jgi:hypothetical protein
LSGKCHNQKVTCQIGRNAGQNADASTEDALLNKKAMSSAEMVICRKLEKAGQNADASTEDALLNKKAMASAEMMVICKKLEKAGQNADASTEDALLNKKSHGICHNGHLGKIGKATHGHRLGAETDPHGLEVPGTAVL